MATSVGTAYVTLMPKMDGFSSKVNAGLKGAGASGGAAYAKGFGKATKSVGGFSAKLGALSGIAGGLAAQLSGTLMSSLSSLSGEIAETADSSQKFAKTLDFAGIDSSKIDELTASTKEYAAATVYDLSDIRNVTAQLAANGVADYGKLAEAAGNLNAVAGGNATTFKSVGMVMTQTAGAGKLTTENWNQLADAIPGASGKLQEAMLQNGAYTGNFREAMEKGQITAEEFNQAVMQLGMSDVAAEAAKSTTTLEGSFGNLKATVVDGMATMLQAATPVITTLTNAFSGVLSGAFEVLGNAATAASDALEQGASPMEAVAAALGQIPGPVKAGAAAFLGLGAAIGVAKAYEAGSGLVSSFKSIGQSLQTIAGKASGAAAGLV